MTEDEKNKFERAANQAQLPCVKRPVERCARALSGFRPSHEEFRCALVVIRGLK